MTFRTDQVGQNVYYFRPDNPFIFADQKQDNIRFNGSLHGSLGQFLLPDEIPPIEPDSSIVSYFTWHQGDFSYREIMVGMSSVNMNGTSVNMKGQGRSFPGKYNHLNPIGSSGDNVLQNYILSLDKQNSHESFSISFYYHRENSGIPVDSYENHFRKSKSYNWGSKYSYKGNSVIYTIDGSFQFLHSETDEESELSYQDFTYWLNTKAEFQLCESMKYSFNYSNKTVNIRPESTADKSLELNSFDSILSYYWAYNIQLDMGALYQSNEKIYPIIRITKNIDNVKIGGSQEVYSAFYHQGAYSLVRKYWQTQSLWIEYDKKLLFFSLVVSHLNYDEKDYLIFQPRIKFRNKLIIFEYKGNYHNSKTSIISDQSELSLEISPLLTNKRYRPYAKIDASILNLNGNINIDFQSENQQSFYPEKLYYDLLNFEIGIRIKNFSASFKMVQFYDQNSRASHYILPVEKMNFLDVYWMFRD